MDVEDKNRVLDAEAINEKLRFQQLYSEMTEGEKSTFIKILQYRAIMSLLEAMKDLKNTPKEVWDNVIMRLKAISGINAPNSKFDFSAMLKTLIPLVGALAGTLLALKEGDKALVEAAEPETTVLTDEALQEEMAKKDEALSGSVVLDLCNKKENKFSLDGSE